MPVAADWTSIILARSGDTCNSSTVIEGSNASTSWRRDGLEFRECLSARPYSLSRRQYPDLVRRVQDVLANRNVPSHIGRLFVDALVTTAAAADAL